MRDSRVLLGRGVLLLKRPGPLWLGLWHITCLSPGSEVLRAAGQPATVMGVPRGTGSPVDLERVSRSLGSQAGVSISVSCSCVNPPGRLVHACLAEWPRVFASNRPLQSG